MGEMIPQCVGAVIQHTYTRSKIARESHVTDLCGFAMRAIPVEVTPNPEK